MKKAILPILPVILSVFLLFPPGADAQTKPRITFLELGSVGCIPCKKMQPVMKNIEQKYGDQIKVIFHDVRKEKEKIDQYRIEMIPTQVFLDENGKEVHRHVGYYPEKAIDEFLKKRGLKIKS